MVVESLTATPQGVVMSALHLYSKESECRLAQGFMTTSPELSLIAYHESTGGLDSHVAVET